MKTLEGCIFLVLSLVFMACTHVADHELLANRMEPDQLTEALTRDIIALSDTIEPKEAFILADAAIRATERLTGQYGMSGPPEYHNIMVNLGFRDRGLCWHWTTDLLNTFFALNLETIDFIWAEAYAGSDLSEHNVAVIVPAADMRLENGLIYDPWRTSGKPYWILLKNDTKYPWQEFPRAKWLVYP